MAAEVLSTVEGVLQAARPGLKERLAGQPDVPEYHQLDAFFQTVTAAGELLIAVVERQICGTLCKYVAHTRKSISRK